MGGVRCAFLADRDALEECAARFLLGVLPVDDAAAAAPRAGAPADAGAVGVAEDTAGAGGDAAAAAASSSPSASSAYRARAALLQVINLAAICRYTCKTV